MPNEKGFKLAQYTMPGGLYNNREFGPPVPGQFSVSGIFIYNGITLLPDFALIGAGLSLSGNTLSVVLNAQAHIDDGAIDADATAPESLDPMATTLAQLVDEVNATNTKYNDLAGKYNDLSTKFNTLLDALEVNGILTP